MKTKTRSFERIRGFLTGEDIQKLEEASKRVLKYPKNPAKKFSCVDCGYNWLYSSVRCPVCSSVNTKAA